MRFASSAPDFECGAPPNAQHWRRLCLGIPGSQCDSSYGTLPHTALVCAPPKRLCTKSLVPTWYLEAQRARRFIRGLEGDGRLTVRVGGSSLLQVLKHSGVVDTGTLRKLMRAQAMQSRRTQRFREHAEVAGTSGFHLSRMSRVGERPVCDSCGASGSMDNVYRWLRTPCPSSHAFDPSATLAELDLTYSDTMALHAALLKLL